jgi:tetratricopeptide (TPR) repeat protein
MLAGEPFGRATLEARKAIHRRFGQFNTWGAYQCYGDPDFSLETAGRGVVNRPPVCVRELILEIDAVTSRAKSAEERAFESLRDRLDLLVRGATERWLRDARLCVALGAAYGELREFEKAIDFYQRARRAEKAEVTIVALEQLANLKSRYAEHLWRDSTRRGAVQKTVDTLLDDADALLRQLVGLEPSAERHALLGGVAKRRVMTRATRPAMVAALAAMAHEYEASYALKVEYQHKDQFYPFINKVVAVLAQSWLEPQRKATAAKRKPKTRGAALAGARLDADIARLREFEAALKSATDFWSLGFLAESALVRALHAGDPNAITKPAMIGRYRRAQRRGRSRREMDSVVTQIRFLSQMAKAADAKAVRQLAAALDRLARQLAEPQG